MKNNIQNIINISLAIIVTLLIFNVFALKEQVAKIDGKSNTGAIEIVKSAYETFENEGDKQWPAGYNPKPLISKSIRNLAVGLVDDKFTLRRV